MDQTQKFLIETLRAYFMHDVIQDASEVDWQCFCRLCSMHGVGGIAYAALKNAEVKIPPAEKQHLENSLFTTDLLCRKTEIRV